MRVKQHAARVLPIRQKERKPLVVASDAQVEPGQYPGAGYLIYDPETREMVGAHYQFRDAALAALDDLPGEYRPADGIQTIRMIAVPVKMVYDVNRFDVVAGRPVRIVLDNPDAQPHNLLVLMPGSLRGIGREVDAMGATKEAKARHWVPDSPKVLHVMAMVEPGDSGELRFIAPSRPGRYPFVCTYPGHWRMMNGVMTVRPGPEE